MTANPNIVSEIPVPPLVYLHFVDREMLQTLGWAPTQAQMGSHLRILLFCTDAPLVSVMPHLWENSALLGTLLGDLLRLFAQEHLEIVCSQAVFPDFVATRREIFAHDPAGYECYFREPPDDLLSLPPTIVKRTNTTAYLEKGLRDTSRAHGYNALAEHAERGGRSLGDLLRAVDQAFRERPSAAVTFAMFRDVAERAVGPRGAQALRLRISELYTEHYLEFLGADIATGISGLSYFDGLAKNFPFLDLPLLEIVVRQLGMSDALLQPFQTSWWDAFLAERGSPAHTVVVDAILQVILTIADRAPEAVRTSAVARRRYIAGMLARMPSVAATGRQSTMESLLLRLADHLRSVLVELGSEFVPDVGRMMMSQRRDAPDGRVLLLTATDVETDAVESVIAETKLRPIPDVRSTICYECGSIGPNHVMCAQTEMGSGGIGGSQATTAELLRELNPSSVIAVGIAFGLRPERQSLGHVLISRQLRSYEAARVGITPDGKLDLRLRGDRVTAPSRMVAIARSAARACRPLVHYAGLMLSGEKLVDHPALRQLLVDSEPEAIGGEMEGSGIYVSASTGKVDWILVKGICDWGDGKKKSSWQGTAAKNAAMVVKQMLRQSAC